MEEENIPQLRGKIEQDIREGYTGGSTDMFIPYGKNIKCYDVNSLYPSVMLNCDMPVGKPTHFIGDLTKFEGKIFGFFKVNVTCPENIMHPIIQIKHKGASGIRTISPVGTFTMWIFSEEMYNAQQFGYVFEILEGYKFEKAKVFAGYVETLYSLRLQYDKLNPLNLIAKILLNSLYGRFGMGEINVKYEVLTNTEFAKLNDPSKIVDTLQLGKYTLVGCEIDSQQNEANISISIASAITAYSRIHMTQFKNNPKINLYYTDTDSIYTDSEIDENLISDTILGKLKLEYECEKAIFLSPKVYILKLENGEIIYKVKGLKHEIELSITDFEQLLCKDSFIEKTQIKWKRNLSDAHIKLLEEVYTLKVTDNKRELIYDENNKLISTKAYKISEDKDIRK